LHFKLQYGEFEENTLPKNAQKAFKTIEKAGLSDEKSRSAITKIQHFTAESK